MKTFSIKLSGPAGAGMMAAGETLSKALNRLGFYTLMYPEYPSRIRGGDNSVLVVFSSEKFVAPIEKINLLLAFGKDNYERHTGEGFEGFKGYEGGEIGLNKIAKELGNPLVANTAGLGFIFKVLGFETKTLEEQIEEEFKNKEEIKKLNLEAAIKGYEIGKSEDFGGFERFLEKSEIANCSGNEALVEGILKAECEFAAIYPMTPINSILAMLAKSKVRLFRPEDEIAGINAAIGASFAGKRAMVATSGGGFSLMIEAVGMAGIAEIPVVAVVGQRTGPSTGMATFSSQADLNFAIYGGHGEFPRIVLAPGDIEECFKLGAEAFNLADKYQVPVILLTDKYLAESRFSVDKKEIEKIAISVDRGKLTGGFEGDEKFGYKRYEFTRDGISPRAFPGQAIVFSNSYEHGEKGFSSDDQANRIKMMNKRMGKIVGLSGGYEGFEGNEGWKKGTTLVGWGSTKEIILDVLKSHPEFNFLHVWRPCPFPKEAIAFLKNSERVIVIEGNYSGQLADLIEKFTLRKVARVLKDDGRPFTKKELESRILNLK